jgi:hypothetical protein
MKSRTGPALERNSRILREGSWLLIARSPAGAMTCFRLIKGGVAQTVFDTRAKPVQALQATVRQLAASPMPGETPDLNRSLEALRVLRLGQDRAGGRGPTAVPAPR